MYHRCTKVLEAHETAHAAAMAEMEQELRASEVPD